MTVMPDALFQATDLARNSRDVMDAARRPGGAVIRDKDGVSFLLSPAGIASRRDYVLDGLAGAIRLLRLLEPGPEPDPVLYGDLAWLAPLPMEDQRAFAWQYAGLLEAAERAGLDRVEQFLYEWQQTAGAWADEDLRAALLSELDAPLHDVEL